MDKDTLKAIKIINEILGVIKSHLGHCVGDTEDKEFISTKCQDLYKIINDNKVE